MGAICIEIRAAEGGRDAELLVEDQFTVYVKRCRLKNLACEITDQATGFISFRVQGDRASDAFEHEAGGHRFQRIPPTERNGRVQTSTISVSVLPEPTDIQLRIDPEDLYWAFTRGSGAGGQNRNVTNSAVDLTHRPTGVTVHVESERSQHQNKALAMSMLRSRMWEAQRAGLATDRNTLRKSQVGSGMRGDKTVTVRFKDAIVTYHQRGKKMSLRDYLAGECP